MMICKDSGENSPKRPTGYGSQRTGDFNLTG
jgi:hypothetical protein